MSNREQSLKLFIVLSRAYRSINDHMNKHIHKHGLNPTEFAVLELLYHKGDQPLQQIGDKILLASGSITYVVDKLEQKQLIIRRACTTDRRVTYAQITDKGVKLLEQIFPGHAEELHQMISVLSAEEKEACIDMLKKVGLNAKNFYQSKE
ncbi:MarR family transcriptional regulator [Bacillus swezeyi]|uniref:MarR family transcriptional regulator n=1 Tax=Bacillus swezeyi TaxID=1925020 RepID=A0A1R1RG44_9BACI|nr:MarR family transcriptional regulator [Bacillus swezeyi]MEC1262379.1 MarR family transcriptional regulator [Bacillus swezeyi]MED2926912.1 MarR family transcriptional regulator [Bacillus swezeyi]MED2943310.1 MarR family transcriptional regulator [Bacillus swezeyi]MED2965526.1 MarR family transcriptional regulator [Bacillus swezeyi]MED2978148.1 MarR family transcriptional regulator [Bacillus swezeyi]